MNSASASEHRPLAWWVMEDALTSRWGHWHEYLQTFKRGLEAAGDSAQFFVSCECDEDVAASISAKRVLPESIWRRMSDGASKWRRLLRIPLHAFATYRSAAPLFDQACRSGRALGQSAMPDVVFVPTVLVHHMLGWLPLVLLKLRGYRSRVVLFFPNTPIQVGADGDVTLSREPTSKLFYLTVRLFSKLVRSGKVVLAAETIPMADALTSLTGIRFLYLPHPVEVGEAVRTVSSSMQAADEPLVVGCYGAARWEKGSDLLQGAIAKILQAYPDINAKFVFQWIEDFADEEGRVIKLNEKLLHHPKVDVLRDYFAGDGYERQLALTNIMSLPYRTPYKLRVSRVVIEAMIMGIPVVTASDTTLNQQAGQFGLDVTCEQNSVDSLADAIVSAIADYPSLKEKALNARQAVQQHFSVKAFRDTLLASQSAGRAEPLST